MRRFLPLGLVIIAGVFVVGCADSEVSASDQEKLRKEFSEDNYEANMKKLGKEKELKEEQERAKAFQQAGGESGEQR